jgi:uncharacterized iron-regulated membrane protein
VKLEPALFLSTVTLSFVGVVLKTLSVHWYVHVASAGCGSQPPADAGAATPSASAATAATSRPLPLTPVSVPTP